MAGRKSARPRLEGSWCVPGSVTASCMASTISAGVGRSGSPIPRLMTSTPAACLAAILRSSSANRYGGMRPRRSLGLMPLLDEVLAELSREHGTCPACQVYVQILSHLYAQLSPVEQYRDLLWSTAQ